jgi:hypothetical protein
MQLQVYSTFAALKPRAFGGEGSTQSPPSISWWPTKVACLHLVKTAAAEGGGRKASLYKVQTGDHTRSPRAIARSDLHRHGLKQTVAKECSTMIGPFNHLERMLNPNMFKGAVAFVAGVAVVATVALASFAQASALCDAAVLACEQTKLTAGAVGHANACLMAKPACESVSDRAPFTTARPPLGGTPYL